MVMQIKLLVVVVVEFLTNPSSWVAFGSNDYVYSRWSNEQYSAQLCSWAATESIDHEVVTYIQFCLFICFGHWHCIKYITKY